MNKSIKRLLRNFTLNFSSLIFDNYIHLILFQCVQIRPVRQFRTHFSAGVVLNKDEKNKDTVSASPSSSSSSSSSSDSELSDSDSDLDEGKILCTFYIFKC